MATTGLSPRGMRGFWNSAYSIPILMGLAKILLHVPALAQYGLFVDEYYYIACSENLAWGYVDHPPLATWLLAIIRFIFGESIYAIRIPVVLIGAGTVFLTGMMARVTGGGRFAQAVAALAVIAAPIYPGVDKFFTTNSLEIFFWTLSLFLLLRILRRNSDDAPNSSQNDLTSWAVLGVVLGAGLMNKHSMLFLGFGIAVALLVTRERRRLLTAGPYLTAAIALLIFLPHIIWQFGNGWPTLEFMENARDHKNYFALGDFISAQILQQHPLLAPLWVGGILYFWFARPSAPFRMAAWIYATLFLLFVILKGKTYYLSPAYPVLYAGGAVWLERALQGGNPGSTGTRVAQAAVLLLIIVSGAVLAPLSLPLLSPENYIAYEKTLGIRPPKIENQKLAKMPQHFAGMFGFPERAAVAIEAYQSLAPEEQRHTAVFARNYGHAGSVEYYLRRDGLKLPVLSAHNNYYLWSLPRVEKSATAQVNQADSADRLTTFITVGYSEDRLREDFADVQAYRTVHCEYCMSNLVEATIYICRRPKRPFLQIFQDTKNYI